MSDFDLSKQSYIDKHEQSLVLGLTHDDFRKQKSDWVKNVLLSEAARRPNEHAACLLDFGFGTGELLDDIASFQVVPTLIGVEPSETLRQEFSKRNSANSASKLIKTVASIEDVKDASVDVITCFNVLHHIPIEKRTEIATLISRKLKSGGALLIWEHNPLNPGTQLVVCRCEYDKDAVLLKKSQAVSLFQNLKVESDDYVNVTPPSFQRYQIFKSLEASLKNFPLGAQYRLILRNIR